MCGWQQRCGLSLSVGQQYVYSVVVIVNLTPNSHRPTDATKLLECEFHASGGSVSCVGDNRKSCTEIHRPPWVGFTMECGCDLICKCAELSLCYYSPPTTGWFPGASESSCCPLCMRADLRCRRLPSMLNMTELARPRRSS